MKTLLLFAFFCAATLACNPPRSGNDPVRRDSIGDPIHPTDTSVNRLDPDSVTDTPEVRF